MSKAIEKVDQSSQMPNVIEQVLVQGDLSKLPVEHRVVYYNRVCESVGLNPLTRPFEYITLNGKMVLYARRDATDQLRKIHGVSITSIEPKEAGDLLIVTAHAVDRQGRTDTATGVVNKKGLAGEALANAMMKSETKAKRRVTLSLCGLGILDETEIPDGENDAPTTVLQPQRASATVEPAQLQLPATNGNSEYISAEQRRTFYNVCIDIGWNNEEVKKTLHEKYGIESSAKIPVEKFDEICKFFKRETITDADIPF